MKVDRGQPVSTRCIQSGNFDRAKTTEAEMIRPSILRCMRTRPIKGPIHREVRRPLHEKDRRPIREPDRKPIRRSKNGPVSIRIRKIERWNGSTEADPIHRLVQRTWYDRMKTGDHPERDTAREQQSSEDDRCPETATFRGQRMPVHEGEPSCPIIPEYRCHCVCSSNRMLIRSTGADPMHTCQDIQST
jgi:hypothetical protein